MVVGSTCLFAVWAGSYHPWYLASYLLFVAAYSLGYGADNFLEKLKKRSLCGLAIGLAGLPMALTTGRWQLAVAQVTMAVVVMVILGIQSKINAAQEELLIGICSAILVPFYV